MLKGLRNQGVDPSHGGEAAAKRAVAMRDRLAANAAWEAVSHPELDGVDFTRDVLPKVRTTPVRQLAKATGLSLIYCSGVRSGLIEHGDRPRLHVPYPMRDPAHGRTNDKEES